MKILMLAINDPAGTAIQFTRALNAHTEHSARLITLETRYTHGWDKDIHVPELGPDGMEEIAILMREADVFHFHMTCDENQTFGPYRPADFINGKQIVHHHHGHHDFRSNPQSFAEKYAEKGRSNLLVSTPDLLHLLPGACWQPNLVPVFDPQYMPLTGRFDEQSTLKICHSPTRKDLKNTDDLLAVVQDLYQKKIRINLDLIDDVPHHICLSRKRRCQAMFDHMQGYYGVSSLEGLSQGVAVIAGLDDWNLAKVRGFAETDNLPWVIARDAAELQAQLRNLHQDRDWCQAVCQQSRYFMVHHWNDQKVAEHLSAFYNHM